MPLSRPTLTQLYDRVKGDFVALPQTGGAILRRSVEWVEAAIVARVAHGLYGYIDDRKANSFPDTGEIEAVRQWGGMFGKTELPALPAAGPVVLTGVESTLIAAGKVIRIGAVRYTVDANVSIVSGTATASVTALEAGAAGNAPEAATGSLADPIAGIDSQVTVGTGGLTGGRDAEMVEPYRTRVLSRLAEPPRGGTKADYEAWIRETPEVSVHKVWVYPHGDGVGTMVASFVVVDAASGTGFALASVGQVDDVQDHVDAQRPEDMRGFRAMTPTGEPLTLSIAMVLESGADLTATRAAVQKSLEAMLGEEAEPETTLPLSRISEAISTTSGERSHTITSPVSSPTPGTGAMFNSVSITWI